VKGRAQIDQLTLPFFSAGNWEGWNHHLRGNIEAFMRAPSQNKKLRVHIGDHTFAFYEEEGKMDMLRWFDYWLKGIDTGIMNEPRVKLCVRTSARECTWRFENEWPIQRTQYTKFYLNPQPSGGIVKGSLNDATLSRSAPATAGKLTYDAGPASKARSSRGIAGASFVTEPMNEEVEITGHTNLVMWVSSETEDMDVFAFLRKVNPDGSVETVSRGMLKVSHRQLDSKLSTAYRPYHTHTVEEKLKPIEIVPIQVEIWATSMVFQKGSRIRLDVMPTDGSHYFSSYHLKNNSVYTGADRSSYILLPIVPPKTEAQTNLGGIKLPRGEGQE
jgi:putative CocE/NonD family hydrolase